MHLLAWHTGSSQAQENLRAYLVGSEEDMRALEKTGADHVAKSVVFLVEGEDGRVRNAYSTGKNRKVR